MLRRAAVAGIAILALLNVTAYAATLTVRQDGSGDYLTIIEAVQAAAAGDTVEVGPGTYGDSVAVDVPLTILSTDGPEATVVHRSRNWWINAGPTRIEGLKFNQLWFTGSSVRIDGAPVTIVDCIFYDNSAGEWGSGGAVGAFNGADLGIEQCYFESNFALDGAAVYIGSGARATVRRCEFFDNRGYEQCGGITVSDATLDVVDCLFNQNYVRDEYGAVNGSGALQYVSSTGSVTGCTFYKNVPGDIELRASPTVSVDRCIFYGSHLGSVGIAYYFDPGPRSCNIFWDSYVWQDDFKSDEWIVSANFCDAEGGDFSISFDSPAAPANNACGELIGAFAPACTWYPDPTLIRVRLDGTGDFTSLPPAFASVSTDGMTVEIGPGVYVGTPLADWFWIRHDITVRSTDGAAATVVDGGAMFFVGAPGKTVHIEGLTLRNAVSADVGNNLYRPGPALSVTAGTVDVVRCVFQDNIGRVGGAVYAKGFLSSIRFTGCEFDNNVAAEILNQSMPQTHGGAVYAQDGAQIDLDGCRFSGNSGLTSAVAVSVAHLDVDSCLFDNNHAHAGAETTSTTRGYGAIAFFRSSGSVTRSTFYSNQSPALSHEIPAGTLVINTSPGVSIERNIFDDDTHGAGVFYAGQSSSPRSCNVFWANGRGAVVPDELSGDEIVADPLFCAPVSGDFTLSENSPASSLSGVCESLAGAFGVGCNPVPVTTVFRASAVEGGVDLGWSISSDVTVTGCWFRRERVGDGFVTRIPQAGLLDHTAGEYADTSPALGESYEYTLIAVDNTGSEHPSYPSVVTDGYLKIFRYEAVAAVGGIDIEWEIDASEPVAGYYLLREDPSGGGVRIPAQGLLNAGSGSYTDPNVELEQEYIYYLTVVDTRQNEHESEAAPVTSLPFSVNEFAADAILERVMLSWEISSTVSPLQCRIAREDLADGEIDLLPPTGYLNAAVDTGYVDDSVEPGRQYRYTLFVWVTPEERYQTRSVDVETGYLSVDEFVVRNDPGGVRVEWDVSASDSLLGFYLNRNDTASDQETRLPAAGLLDAYETTYIDDQAAQNVVYFYSLVVVDWQSVEHTVATAGLKTAYYPYSLGQNQPNPFNPGTVIPYSINEQINVTLVVYDVLGRHVRTLVDGTRFPGTYTESWDGTNEAGGTVASGVYLYRLRAGSFEQTRKMTLLR